jgi:hypothetical protein
MQMGDEDIRADALDRRQCGVRFCAASVRMAVAARKGIESWRGKSCDCC